ncbi:MAG: PKD domain-containing protein [Pseudomonadota bacterium]
MRHIASLLATLMTALALPVLAANPASGTLSPSSPELSYSYGPNAVSNPTAQAEQQCMAPIFPCDAYALTIEIPAGGPAYSLTVSSGWSAPADDYDLYFFNEDGVEVGRAAGSANPETFTLTAVPGVYNVRLVPFAVTGSTANTTITLTAADAGPPPPVIVPPTGLAPRYKLHVSPAGLAEDAGEPTIGYNPLSKRGMFIAFTQANRITFKENLPAPADDFNATLPESCDALWENKSGTLTTANTLDPLMYTDKVTGRTFNSQLSGANSLFEFSDDDGENWMVGQIGPANGGADHQGMVTGPYPEGQRPPTARFPNAFYYCSQSVATAFCARSDDGGQTQGPGFTFKNLDCAAGGLHGHPQVAPDGTLYIPDSSQCIASTGVDGSSGKAIVHRSLDAGVTYEQFALPESTGGGASDPSIGIATDGTAYYCYENADGRARMAVSKDRGETWSNDQDIGAALGLVATRFPAAIAGDPDRASCHFLGTTTEGPSSSLAFEGVWYPYVATTYDGGLTYHLVNLSPDDPVQGKGGIGPDGTNRNLLDFNDLEIDEMGRTLVAYADGCVGGCVIDPAANSFAAKGTIARQTGGRTLFAAFDNQANTQFNAASPLPPTAACAVQAKSIRSNLRTRVSWNAPDNGGSPITNYELFRATNPAGPFSSVAVTGTKTSFNDPSTDPTVETYYYRVVAENALGKAAVGNIIGLPLTEEIVVNTCEVPGEIIATSPVNETLPADVDGISLAVAEPPGFDDQLVVTIKVRGFTGGRPVGTFYGALFPTRGNRYVALDTTQGAPAFVFGTFTVGVQGLLTFAREGNLPDTSGFEPDGTIRLVVPKEVFGGLAPGAVLSGFDVRIRAGSATATSRDTIGPADYIVRGNANCGNTPPIATLAVSTNSAAPNDVVTFTIGGSDADTNDTIASYSLDFGDGQSLMNQAASSLPTTVTHRYTSAGNYAARLTVQDSRGLVSSNVAAQTINIAQAPGGGGGGGGSGGGVPNVGGSSGGGSFGLALLPLALLALRRKRRH